MSILETIDGALADYEASGDAVRWVPVEKREARPRPLVLPAGISLNGSAWAPVSSDLITLRPPADGEGLRLDAEMITRGFEQFAVGVRRFFDDLGTALAPLVRVLRTIAEADAERERRRRGGGKLAVNGHEYQRRRKARRRRRR